MSTKPSVKELLEGFFLAILEEQTCPHDCCEDHPQRTPAETKAEAEQIGDRLCSVLVDSDFIICIEATY